MPTVTVGSRRVLRLHPALMLKREHGALLLQAPAAWAQLWVHERCVWPVLHDLSLGCTVRQAAASLGATTESAAQLLALMQWCGLLDDGADAWPAHDRLLHAHTRRGYASQPIGKQPGAALGPTAAVPRGERVPLPRPSERQLMATDPAFAQVVLERRSLREQGRRPLTLAQLGEFLWRCFAGHDRHRPYPSGGAVHALSPHLLVRACQGLAPGLYAYDAAAHALRRQRGHATVMRALLQEAAATAGITKPPQVLCVLSADMPRVHAAYGGLGYSLVLKEVGAVMQTAALSASAMGLAVCPLGTGNALQFERLSGLDERRQPAVGEFMLGSCGP